jgi:hypothetical protein
VVYQLAEGLDVENSGLQTLELSIKCINVELRGRNKERYIGKRTEGLKMGIESESNASSRRQFPRMGRVLKLEFIGRRGGGGSQTTT